MHLLTIARSVLAIVLGYLLFALPSFLVFKLFKQPPHEVAPLWFMTTAFVSGMFFALLGGYGAGLVAGRSALGHGIGVAVLLALGASASLASTLGKGGAIWSQLAALTLMAPSAIAGGWLRQRQCKQQAGDPR